FRRNPTLLGIEVLVAFLVAVAHADRRYGLEGVFRSRANAWLAHLLLTHQLLQALLQVTADQPLRAGAVGTDHIDHEFLGQNGLGQMFLLGYDLEQYAARNVGIVFLVDDDEFNPLDHQAPDIRQRDVPALHRVI